MYLTTKKRGYCSPPMSATAKREGICGDDGAPEITLANYNIHNCLYMCEQIFINF